METNKCSCCGDVTDELAIVDGGLYCQFCFDDCGDVGDRYDRYKQSAESLDKAADYILKNFNH